MRRVWVAVLAVGVAGCAAGGDPTNDKLEAGSQAVAVIPEGSRDTDVTLFASPTSPKGEVAVGLAPGVRVTIGNDPGYYDQTQMEIDRRIEDAKDPEMREFYKKMKPEKLYPPSTRARDRKVAVVVETGEYKGRAGLVIRDNLRPAAP